MGGPVPPYQGGYQQQPPPGYQQPYPPQFQQPMPPPSNVAGNTMIVILVVLAVLTVLGGITFAIIAMMNSSL